MDNSIVLLGSTGSIGKNTLFIAKKFNIRVEGLVAGKNFNELNKQISIFKPKFVAVKDKETAEKVNFDKVLYGKDAILEIIEKSKSNLIINALVGSYGLKPTLKAISLSKKVALANKESLVIAGKFIDISKITPIDSEHFGLLYLLQNKKEFKKLYITASGGALREWSIEQIKHAKVKDVLKHPNWSMGAKITVDSATMVNKIFELLEAKWLFNTTKIDAFIEKKSIIHSAVDWIDGSTTFHVSKTDMKLPIAYAILKNINEPILKNINLLEIKNLEFQKISSEKYPVWAFKDEILNNDNLGVVINSINDIAVDSFLKEKIDFLSISKLIIKGLNKFNNIQINSINEIFLAKKEIKEWARREIESYSI